MIGGVNSPSIIFTMPILFDHNSVTGVSQYFDYDPAKDTYYLTSTQDISGMLDNIKKSRDNPEIWNKGVKQEWAHFASIPPVVEMQLKQKGIDMYNPSQTKELIKEINTKFDEFLEIKDEIDSLRMTGEARCTGESPPVPLLLLVINPDA